MARRCLGMRLSCPLIRTARFRPAPERIDAIIEAIRRDFWLYRREFWGRKKDRDADA